MSDNQWAGQRYTDSTAEMGSDGHYALITIDNETGTVTVADDAEIDGDYERGGFTITSPSTPMIIQLTRTSMVLREGKPWFSLLDAVDAIRRERVSS